MKVKRFNNLWSMGLIICGALLVFFYVAKLFFPQFIVGIAEVPSIVAFGKFVDSHWWAILLFNIVTTFTIGYIYCCACCRTKKLTTKQLITFIAFSVVGITISYLLPSLYSPYSYTILIFVPFVLSKLENNLNADTYTSTAICFSIDIMAQALSLEIRNIILMTKCVNSATLIILLIDAWIWRVLLYLYFNAKEGGN